MGVRAIDDVERRARLGHRHRIEPAEAASIEDLTDLLVVLHATDPATIYLSVGARRPGTTIAEIDDALFERRTIYRTLAMRRTLFVASGVIGPAVEGSAAPRTAAQERKRLLKFLVDTGIEQPENWLGRLFDEVGAALADDDGGVGRTARELVGDVPRLGTKLVAGVGTAREMEISATSRVLGLMAVDGLLVRGRPTGGWTARQYRWHRRDGWWPDDATRPDPLDDPVEAATQLLGHYLARFGPATLTDLVWWTGWTKTLVRRAIEDLAVVEVALENQAGGEPGLVLADDVDPVEAPGPWAALLPSLDPTPMGWKQRDWYLGEHQGPLFDRNGNIGPTIWLDGRIVGGWSQRSDGQVVTELLEPVGADGLGLIAKRVEALAAFVDPLVIKPSFPTPLQKRLSAG